MTERRAKKRARELYNYIEDTSGYRDSSRSLRKMLTRKFVIIIRANGEVQQEYIDAMVRIFSHAKQEREAQAASRPPKGFTTLPA